MKNEEMTIGEGASDVNIGQNASGGVHVGMHASGDVTVGYDASGDVFVGSKKSTLKLVSKEIGTEYETTLGDLLEQLSALKAEVNALKNELKNQKK